MTAEWKASERPQVREVQRAQPLHERIAKLRADTAAEAAAAAKASTRPEVDLFDAAVHVAVGTAGKPAVERREALCNVEVGKTLTGAAHGRITGKEQVSARRLTRQEKFSTALTWGQEMTQEQRDDFVASDKFLNLPDSAAEIISEAFAQLEDRAYEDSIGIQNIDLDASTPTVDEIIGTDDEVDDVYDDFDADWEVEAQ
jgi:hypothetical protein